VFGLLLTEGWTPFGGDGSEVGRDVISNFEEGLAVDPSASVKSGSVLSTLAASVVSADSVELTAVGCSGGDDISK
jgi:hypothetical protein